MGPGQYALLREGSLIAFLESAAVRDSSKIPGIDCGSSSRLNRVNIWFLSLKLKSTRVSKELRFSLSTGEEPKFEVIPVPVGVGYRFNKAMAFASNRLAGSLLRSQAAAVNTTVAAEQPVLAGPKNGSRTKPPPAGPFSCGIQNGPDRDQRPKASVWVPDCSRSDMSV